MTFAVIPPKLAETFKRAGKDSTIANKSCIKYRPQKPLPIGGAKTPNSSKTRTMSFDPPSAASPVLYTVNDDCL